MAKHWLKRIHHKKLILLILIIIASYIFFSNPNSQEIINRLNTHPYLTIFIAGFLFSFGFSTPIAIGLFALVEPSNIWLAILLGGVGSTMSDFLIYKATKFSLKDEIESLEKTKSFMKIRKEIDRDIPKRLKTYLLGLLAGIIIASPLPDEVGVPMLAGLSHITEKEIILISFIFKTIGIALLLLL